MKKLILGAAMAAGAVVMASPAAAQDGGRMMAAMFPDPNGDGITTRDEMVAASAERFAKLDTNTDGKLSQAEQEAGPGGRMLARADTNGDGAVSKDEMTGAAAMRFARIDTNKDDKIDAAEKDAARQRMQQMRGGGN